MLNLLLLVFMFQGPHSVTINWTASPDAAANPTLSYNIYRAVGSCTNTFVKINSTAAGVLAFTDTNVTVGQTYCYQATAVLNGLESIPSNQDPAVILPAPPAITVTVK